MDFSDTKMPSRPPHETLLGKLTSSDSVNWNLPFLCFFIYGYPDFKDTLVCSSILVMHGKRITLDATIESHTSEKQIGVQTCPTPCLSRGSK